jgi:ATP-dependent Clp endopeptidase proteolytic subunit ClpP
MPKATGKPTWFKMSADAQTGVGTINIFGEIGGWGIDFRSFSRELDSLGAVSELKIFIDSPGGDVFAGNAIYNALQMHPAQKTVTVMGLAASMASVIAMAGDRRIMPKNAMLMIHNPVGAIIGTSEELIAYGEAVANMRSNIAAAYVEASGGKLSEKKAYDLMDAQTWLTAEESVSYGLATEVAAPMQAAAQFDLSRYANAPKNLTTNSEVATQESAMTTAATPEAPKSLTEAEARADERAKILATQAQVNALCKIAKRPDLAASFNEKGLTVEQAMVEIEKAKPTDDVELSARQRLDVGDNVVAIDSNKIWDNYNRKRA